MFFQSSPVRALLVSLTSLLPASVFAQTDLTVQEIRIPAIFHKWKLPGDEGQPETTIDELSKCMGTDVDMGRRVGGIKHQQSQLEFDLSESKRKLDLLAPESAAISSEKTKLEAEVESFKSFSSSLDQRRTAIERHRSNKRLLPSEVKQFNSMIDTFNQELTVSNKRRSSLLLAEQSLKAKIATYNTSVSEANERVAYLNERNTEFKAIASQFNTELSAYIARCEGEKVLKK